MIRADKKLTQLAVVLMITVMLTGCSSGVDKGTSNQNFAAVQQPEQTQLSEAAGQTQTEKATDKTQPEKASMQPSKAPENRTMQVCGIYIYNENAGRREFVENTYESRWEKGSDIMCFEVFNTHEKTISGKVFKYTWEPVWFTTADAADYRIGYSVKFQLKDKTTVIQHILEPEDTLKYKDYMEFYLYDDYHQTPGVWYSHVEQNAYNSDTLLTSVKFTAGKNVEQIEGDVELTAFIYNPSGNELDSQGRYTGNSKAVITVKNTAQ